MTSTPNGTMPTVVAQRGDLHGQAVVQRLKAMGVTPRCVDRLTDATQDPAITNLANSIPGAASRGWIRSLPLVPRQRLDAEVFAWQALLDGIGSDPFIEWLSPLAMIRQADNKLYQLRLAQLLGILAPTTAVPCKVADIAELASKAVVVKPLGSGVTVSLDGTQKVFYTTSVNIDQLTDEALQAAPVIVQERIPVEQHLRVVTVAGDVWCAAMDARGHALDWRESSTTRREWHPVEPPGVVRRGALNIANRAVIGYSSQDWLQADHRHYFIDLNPCGKWLFLPDPMRDQITAAIATWLTGSAADISEQ